MVHERLTSEPDVRFSYANERTILARIGLPLIALGVVVALLSLHNWRANERAMRLDSHFRNLR